MSFAKLAVAALTAGAFALLQLGVQASDVTITKGPTDRNPTLLFKGIAGNAQMSAQVERDLRMCGWFDVVTSGGADYVVGGNANGTAVALGLYNAANVLITQLNSNGDATDKSSHKAVDALLKYLFKVDGICATKIAFSALVATGKKEIYICDFDGSNFQQVTHDGILALEPVWSPGGKSIVYCAVGGDSATLIECDMATKRFRRLAQFPGYNGGGAISPNGGTVALVLSKGDQLDLYTRSVNGSDLHRITNDRAVEASPCWSPDGSKICFVSDSGNTGRPNLFTVGASGGGLTRLPGKGSENVSPSWSKDGRIAYSAKLGSYTLAVIDLTGKSSHLSGVIIADGDWKAPSWAPDNRHVVCEHNGQLWVADTWTGKTRLLVSGKSKVSIPNWSPLLY